MDPFTLLKRSNEDVFADFVARSDQQQLHVSRLVDVIRFYTSDYAPAYLGDALYGACKRIRWAMLVGIPTPLQEPYSRESVRKYKEHRLREYSLGSKKGFRIGLIMAMLGLFGVISSVIWVPVGALAFGLFTVVSGFDVVDWIVRMLAFAWLGWLIAWYIMRNGFYEPRWQVQTLSRWCQRQASVPAFVSKTMEDVREVCSEVQFEIHYLHQDGFYPLSPILVMVLHDGSEYALEAWETSADVHLVLS